MLSWPQDLTAYIVKINEREITLEEFQEFVDVQKFIAKEDSLDDFLASKKITRSELLGDYINLILLYRSANQLGYSFPKKHPSVVKRYEETKEEQLITLFVNQQVNILNSPPTETELKQEYARVRNNNDKTFSDLSKQEQEQLYQISILRKIQDEKRNYRLKLEKEYKIRRTPKDKNNVARINNSVITQEQVDELLRKEVTKLGISIDALREQEPAKYEQVRVDALNELIFQELIKMEIEKEKFDKKKIVQSSLKFHSYQIAIEEYVKAVIAPKVPISSRELDSAFVQVSKTRPGIQKMLPTQQEKLLRSLIIQNKLPEIIESEVNEKKEASIILRNKEKIALLK